MALSQLSVLSAIIVHTASALPKVSLITVGHPMRRSFKWNTLTNFLKQDYSGPLELVFVDSDEYDPKLFGERLSTRIVEEGKKAPDMTRDYAVTLAGKNFKPLQRGGPRYILHVNSSGILGKRRNAGIDAATGSIIAGCDDDDVYDYSYVSHIVETFTKHPESMLVYAQRGMRHEFAIDGSVTAQGYHVDMHGAGGHAFRKEAWAKCPYANKVAAEEHFLVDCMRKEWSDRAFMQLTQKPSNGVGYIKLEWSGGTCAHVWANSQVQQQNDRASFAGYWGYFQRVVRNLHYLQEMNGGSDALDHLREIFPKVEFPYLPPVEIQLNSHISSSAKCKQWDVLVEMDPENDSSSPAPLVRTRRPRTVSTTASGKISVEDDSFGKKDKFRLRVNLNDEGKALTQIM